MSEFTEFMGSREKLIDRGLIGHNREIVAKLNIELATKRNPGFRAIAGNVARSDKSDPFLYDRVMSHLQSGTTLPHDYGVDWKNEQMDSPLASQLSEHPFGRKERVQIQVLVPHKRKVPCL